MKSIDIEDTKGFMSALFVKEVFDQFLVKEANITTFSQFIIDGKMCKDFFNSDELGENPEDYICWSLLKPYCYNIIKGKKIPVSMKFVLSLCDKQLDSLLSSVDTGIKKADINALSINVRFENNKAVIITGTSLKTFTLDKSLEDAWDKYIEKFVLAL